MTTTGTYRIMTLHFDGDKEPLRVCVPGNAYDALKDRDLHVLRVEFSQAFPIPDGVYFDSWHPAAVKGPEIKQ